MSGARAASIYAYADICSIYLYGLTPTFIAERPEVVSGAGGSSSSSVRSGGQKSTPSGAGSAVARRVSACKEAEY